MATSEGLSKGKTMVILAIMVGCFAVLFPKIFLPMFQQPPQPASSSSNTPPPMTRDRDKAGRHLCCGVVFESDASSAAFLTELCSLVLTRKHDPHLSVELLTAGLHLHDGSLYDSGSAFQMCRMELLDKCGIDLDLDVVKSDVDGAVKTPDRLRHHFGGHVRAQNLTRCLQHHFDIDENLVRAKKSYHPPSEVYYPRHMRPERPPHLHPDMMHPALREKGRAIPPPTRTIDKQAKPGPMPGMRPPMGGGGHIVSQNPGSGGMGILMPIYTCGIVVFFLYTIMKIAFKKQPEETSNDPRVKDFHLDPEHRKFLFAEEYCTGVPGLVPEMSVQDYAALMQQAAEHHQMLRRNAANNTSCCQPPEVFAKKDEELEPIEEHIVQSSKAAIEEIPVPEESAADDQPEETGQKNVTNNTGAGVTMDGRPNEEDDDERSLSLALAELKAQKEAEMDQLRRRLEETERAMERICRQMGNVTEKLSPTAVAQLMNKEQEESAGHAEGKSEWDQVLAQVEESYEQSHAQPSYTPAYLPVLDRRSARLSPAPADSVEIVADEQEEEVGEEEECEAEEIVTETVSPQVELDSDSVLPEASVPELKGESPIQHLEDDIEKEETWSIEATPSRSRQTPDVEWVEEKEQGEETVDEPAQQDQCSENGKEEDEETIAAPIHHPSSPDWELESQTTEGSSVVTCIEQSPDAAWDEGPEAEVGEIAVATVAQSSEATWETSSQPEVDVPAEECVRPSAVADWLRESQPEEEHLTPSQALETDASPSVEEAEAPVEEEIPQVQEGETILHDEECEGTQQTVEDEEVLDTDEVIQSVEEIHPVEKVAEDIVEEANKCLEDHEPELTQEEDMTTKALDEEIVKPDAEEIESIVKEKLFQQTEEVEGQLDMLPSKEELLLQTPQVELSEQCDNEQVPESLAEVENAPQEDHCLKESEALESGEILSKSEHQVETDGTTAECEQEEEKDKQTVELEVAPLRHGSEERKMTVMGFDSMAAMENLGKMPPELLPKVDSRPSPSRTTEIQLDPEQVTSVLLDTTIPPESHLVVSEAECSAEAVPAEQLDLDATEYESNPVVLSGKMVLSVIGMDLPVEEPEIFVGQHHHRDEAVPRVTFPPEPYDKKIFLIPSIDQEEEEEIEQPASPMMGFRQEEEDEQGDDSAVPYRPPTPPLKHSRDEEEPPVDPNSEEFLTYEQLEEAGEAIEEYTTEEDVLPSAVTSTTSPSNDCNEEIEDDGGNNEEPLSEDYDRPVLDGGNRILEEALNSMVESILTESIAGSVQQLQHSRECDREQSPDAGPLSSDMAACMMDVQYEVLGSGSSSLDAADLQEEDFERNREEVEMEYSPEKIHSQQSAQEMQEEEEEELEEEPVISDFTIREDYPDEDQAGQPLSEEEFQRARHEIEEIKRLLAEVRIRHEVADELQSSARNVISELSHAIVDEHGASTAVEGTSTSKGSSPDMEEYEVIPQARTAADEQDFPLNHPDNASS